MGGKLCRCRSKCQNVDMQMGIGRASSYNNSTAPEPQVEPNQDALKAIAKLLQTINTNNLEDRKRSLSI